MMTHLRPAVRSLVRAPGFSLATVLILAVGIGVSTAVFSVLHAVLLRPLPYEKPHELVRLWATMPQRDNQLALVSWLRVQFLQESTKGIFAGLAANSGASFTVTGRGEPELISAIKVTGDFFSLLGVPPLLGRAPTPAEDQPGAANVVLLAEGYWRRAFAGDRGVIGRPLMLNGTEHTIIGVMPARFTTPFDTNDVWVTRAFESAALPATSVARGGGFLNVVARLRPGVTLQQAQAALDTVAKSYAASHAGFMDETFGLRAIPFQEEISGDSRRPLWLLFAAVSVVLLISCANVANLCLTRSLGQRRAIAIRTALGAGRRQVVAQFLAEGLLLSLAAAVLGLALAHATLPPLTRLAADYLPRLSEIGLSVPVLGFATGLALLCGLGFGLVPLLQVSNVACQEALRDGARGSTDAPANLRFRQALLAAEVALALVLTFGAGLLVVSFQRVQRVDPGFRVEGLYRANLPLAGAQFAAPAARGQLLDRLLERVQQAPGVASAAFVLGAPYANESSLFTAVLPGRPANDPKERHVVRYCIATPGYFATLGAPLVAGRDLTTADNTEQRRVAVVNEAMAKQLFPDGRALEREFVRPFDQTTWRIVGIVRDLRNASLIDAVQPETYFPHHGNPYTQISFVIRSQADVGLAAQAARAALRDVGAQLPLVGGQPVAALMADSLAQRRLALALLLVFAGVSALLAAAGIGALSAYTVSQRRYEIGVRLALGASGGQVVREIVLQALRPVAAGLLLGIVGSLWVSSLVAHQLFATAPNDPVVIAATSVLLGAVALVASWLPARRAARTDPLLALRSE